MDELIRENSSLKIQVNNLEHKQNKLIDSVKELASLHRERKLLLKRVANLRQCIVELGDSMPSDCDAHGWAKQYLDEDEKYNSDGNEKPCL